MSDNIGKIIKNYRDEHNLTQEQFGKLVGVQRSAVSKWEKGHVSNMKADVLLAASKLVGISPYTFMGWDEKYNPDGKLANEVNVIELVQKQYGKEASELLINFNQLNDIGKKKVIENTIDLTTIEKYTFQEKGDLKAL